MLRSVLTRYVTLSLYTPVCILCIAALSVGCGLLYKKLTCCAMQPQDRSKRSTGVRLRNKKTASVHFPANQMQAPHQTKKWAAGTCSNALTPADRHGSGHTAASTKTPRSRTPHILMHIRVHAHSRTCSNKRIHEYTQIQRHTPLHMHHHKQMSTLPRANTLKTSPLLSTFFVIRKRSGFLLCSPATAVQIAPAAKDPRRCRSA